MQNKLYEKIYDMVELYRNNRNVFFYTDNFHEYTFNFSSLAHYIQHDILCLGLMYCEDVDADELLDQFDADDIVKFTYDEGVNLNTIKYMAMKEKIYNAIEEELLILVDEVVADQLKEEEPDDTIKMDMDVWLDNQARAIEMNQML